MASATSRLAWHSHGIIDRPCRLFYHPTSFLSVFDNIIRVGLSNNEKNIPTQQNQTCQNPRFPCQNGDSRWPQSLEFTPCERPSQIDRLDFGLTNNDFGFPSQCRLKKPAEYKKVFAKPVKSSDQYFTLLAIRNDLDHPRLGLAIAKKNIKKAVHRNIIKRTVRENFRLQQHLGNIDIVVLARREAVDAPLDILRKSLDKHWLKLVTRCASLSLHS
jgi:ribonuclease P protein component